uniref:Uncharacterized protein n=1 Tax=Mus musculus TaxID=10090 RepID=Q9D4W7_MOUSE|nr:unnamed protein product [Mus musculus]
MDSRKRKITYSEPSHMNSSMIGLKRQECHKQTESMNRRCFPKSEVPNNLSSVTFTLGLNIGISKSIILCPLSVTIIRNQHCCLWTFVAATIARKLVATKYLSINN